VAKTVLIVDDHEGFRSFARRILEAGGLNVIGEVADGASAVIATRALDPDLVLLDVMLPDDDGFAVAERIADAGGRACVVLTSSRELDDLRERLARTPARGFIPKHELSADALVATAQERR
jgi:DNA-binding NarL/FixJ family response regulator